MGIEAEADNGSNKPIGSLHSYEQNSIKTVSMALSQIDDNFP
jgi:hypothetical protein